MIKHFKDFLTPREQLVINQTIMSPRWQWGHGSNGLPNQGMFWKIDSLEKEEFYLGHLLNKIKELTGDEFEVDRIYMNGHTACSQAYTHKDSLVGTGRTFLVYCNEHWDSEFGGGTCFNIDGEYITNYPYPYSAVYFQNNIDHFAMPLSRNFNGLRVTLAFKLYLK